MRIDTVPPSITVAASSTATGGSLTGVMAMFTVAVAVADPSVTFVGEAIGGGFGSVVGIGEGAVRRQGQGAVVWPAYWGGVYRQGFNIEGRVIGQDARSPAVED